MEKIHNFMRQFNWQDWQTDIPRDLSELKLAKLVFSACSALNAKNYLEIGDSNGIALASFLWAETPVENIVFYRNKRIFSGELEKRILRIDSPMDLYDSGLNREIEFDLVVAHRNYLYELEKIRGKACVVLHGNGSAEIYSSGKMSAKTKGKIMADTENKTQDADSIAKSAKEAFGGFMENLMMQLSTGVSKVEETRLKMKTDFEQMKSEISQKLSPLDNFENRVAEVEKKHEVSELEIRKDFDELNKKVVVLDKKVKLAGKNLVGE